MTNKKYAVRYFVEDWGKPAETKGSVEVMPGVRVSSSNIGYTDTLFVASIVRNEDGTIESILLLDSDSQGGGISRETLEAVRDAINHHLEHHS